MQENSSRATPDVAVPTPIDSAAGTNAAGPAKSRVTRRTARLRKGDQENVQQADEQQDVDMLMVPPAAPVKITVQQMLSPSSQLVGSSLVRFLHPGVATFAVHRRHRADLIDKTLK